MLELRRRIRTRNFISIFQDQLLQHHQVAMLHTRQAVRRQCRGTATGQSLADSPQHHKCTRDHNKHTTATSLTLRRRRSSHTTTLARHLQIPTLGLSLQIPTLALHLQTHMLAQSRQTHTITTNPTPAHHLHVHTHKTTLLHHHLHHHTATSTLPNHQSQNAA